MSLELYGWRRLKMFVNKSFWFGDSNNTCGWSENIIVAFSFSQGGGTIVAQTIGGFWLIVNVIYGRQFVVVRVRNSSVLNICGSPWRFRTEGWGKLHRWSRGVRTGSDRSWSVKIAERSIIEVATMFPSMFFAGVNRESVIRISNLKRLVEDTKQLQRRIWGISMKIANHPSF